MSNVSSTSFNYLYLCKIYQIALQESSTRVNEKVMATLILQHGINNAPIKFSPHIGSTFYPKCLKVFWSCKLVEKYSNDNGKLYSVLPWRNKFYKIHEC